MGPKVATVGVTSISEGLNLIEFDGQQPPQPLNLLNSSPELYNFAGTLANKMELLSGVSSIVRGTVSPSLSGAAMALLASQSIQQNSAIQSSYVALLEDLGTLVINHLKRFATTKRMVDIVGKYNKSLLKEFSGADLSDISRVTVDVSNPLTKTIAGRTELANQLLQSGLIKRADQYLMVLQTGQLDNMIDAETMSLQLMRQENELLAEGRNPPVLVLDDHAKHIQEHMAVLNTPEARLNTGIVNATLAHIQEHLNQAQAANPAVLAILGRAPIAQPAPAPQQGADVSQVMNNNNPVMEAGSAVAGPAMPKNPLTGAQFQA